MKQEKNRAAGSCSSGRSEPPAHLTPASRGARCRGSVPHVAPLAHTPQMGMGPCPLAGRRRDRRRPLGLGHASMLILGEARVPQTCIRTLPPPPGVRGGLGVPRIQRGGVVESCLAARPFAAAALAALRMRGLTPTTRGTLHSGADCWRWWRGAGRGFSHWRINCETGPVCRPACRLRDWLRRLRLRSRGCHRVVRT